jgi:hypothetical protein
MEKNETVEHRNTTKMRPDASIHCQQTLITLTWNTLENNKVPVHEVCYT